MYTRWIVDLQQVGLLEAPSTDTHKFNSTILNCVFRGDLNNGSMCECVFASRFGPEHLVNRMEQPRTLFVEPNNAIYAKRNWHRRTLRENERLELKCVHAHAVFANPSGTKLCARLHRCCSDRIMRAGSLHIENSSRPATTKPIQKWRQSCQVIATRPCFWVYQELAYK